MKNRFFKLAILTMALLLLIIPSFTGSAFAQDLEPGSLRRELERQGRDFLEPFVSEHEPSKEQKEQGENIRGAIGGAASSAIKGVLGGKTPIDRAAKATAGAITGTCNGCHETVRERERRNQQNDIRYERDFH